MFRVSLDPEILIGMQCFGMKAAFKLLERLRSTQPQNSREAETCPNRSFHSSRAVW